MPATLDDALEILAQSGPEFGGGLSNHGPMAAEALVRLGRPEEVVGWTESYRRRLLERPQARDHIVPTEWREALGDITRVEDWSVFFRRQLDAASWPDVLARWVPRLAPGLVAAATHGVIRTAHAVRSLEDEATPLRLRELAEGLAYWAARYQTLPGTPSPAGDLPPSEALQRVALLPEEQRGNDGLITEGLDRLHGFPPFEAGVNAVAAPGDADGFLSQLTETFAHAYLANAAGGRVIAFIHGVTGPATLRIIAPYLDPAARTAALVYAWQAGAAIYSAYGQTPRIGVEDDVVVDIEDLVDRSVATGDEHAIKFTEACLREHRLNPATVFLAAAADATRRIEAWGR
ncbi:MAG: questin oxidase family protein [Dehalococcoidia bacterium]